LDLSTTSAGVCGTAHVNDGVELDYLTKDTDAGCNDDGNSLQANAKIMSKIVNQSVSEKEHDCEISNFSEIYNCPRTFIN
jgi:hypothetical protein